MGGLGQTKQVNPRPKFITRPNQQMLNNVNTASSMNTTGGRKLSKNESRSPSMKLQGTKAGVRPKKDSVHETHVTEDLNLTAVQAEEVNQAPRDSYTAFANPTVLTPEPVIFPNKAIVPGQQEPSRICSAERLTHDQ